MIFLDFLKVKKSRKYAPKRTKLHHSKKNSGSMLPNPPSKRMATPRVASPSPPQKKIVGPPLANPACAHELLLRNLFGNPLWQTVDCV